VRIVFRRPCLPELRSWVSAVWWSQDAAVAESVLPAGRAHLVLPLSGGWRAGVLHGPASRPRLAEPVPREPVIGVVFRPGGTRPLVEAPADMLADLSVPLPELCSRDLSGLAGRLASRPGQAGEPASPALLLDRFERVLAAQAGRMSPDAALIGAALRELRQGASIAGVAARLTMDRRALGGIFRREVGFGLKRYARLARFEQALRAVRAADAPSLSLIAARLSFADQAHLTREFGDFAGFPPGRLHRVAGPTPWHVVHDETFKTGRPDHRTLSSWRPGQPDETGGHL
jgi:AraC-like DNA-binding protein